MTLALQKLASRSPALRAPTSLPQLLSRRQCCSPLAKALGPQSSPRTHREAASGAVSTILVSVVATYGLVSVAAALVSVAASLPSVATILSSVAATLATVAAALPPVTVAW